MQKPAKKVKIRLMEQDRTLTGLARELGVAYSYLLDVLHGRRKSKKLIKRIAEAMDWPELEEIYEKFWEESRGVSGTTAVNHASGNSHS
ncbi:MAG: helix-turn-helix transcriptional regulator [Desulfurobacteriaceae bacterium]